MRKLWIIPMTVIAVAILVLQYVAYTPNIPPLPEPCDSNKIGERDYSIYRALLEENPSQARTRDGATAFILETVEIPDTHIDESSVEWFREQILESGGNVVLSCDAEANFLRLSREKYLLDRKRFTDLPLGLADRFEVGEYPYENAVWEASTIVQFSRIGFSCDGNQALMYRSQACIFCGSGDFVILEKNRNKWQIVLTVVLWES